MTSNGTMSFSTQAHLDNTSQPVQSSRGLHHAHLEQRREWVLAHGKLILVQCILPPLSSLVGLSKGVRELGAHRVQPYSRFQVTQGCVDLYT